MGKKAEKEVLGVCYWREGGKRRSFAPTVCLESLEGPKVGMGFEGWLSTFYVCSRNPGMVFLLVSERVVTKANGMEE